MATHTAHESHGWHPMAMVGFTTLLIGGVFSALWLVTLADLPENKPTNIAYGIIALGMLLGSAAILTAVTRRLHHSPLFPDNTEPEIKRYLWKVGRD